MQTTGNALDLALDGDGYFQVQLPGGQLGYTRSGNFSRSPEGLLITSEGYQVMPGITVPDGTTAITIGTDGTVSRSEEHTSELQSLMRNSYAVFCLKKKTQELSKNRSQNNN